MINSADFPVQIQMETGIESPSVLYRIRFVAIFLIRTFPDTSDYLNMS